MSALLDAEAWLDEQLAAANPPQQDLAVLPDQPGTSPLLSAAAPEDPAKTSLYDMAPAEAPRGGNSILYPRFTDLTLPQTPRGPVPEDPVEANRQANESAFGDDRMDAEAWLDNAVATTPTPRSVKLPSGISSYGNDFLKTIDTSKMTPEEYLSINPDVEVVRGMLHNPQYKPTFEEWQDLSAIEERLVKEGKIKKPGNLEIVGNAVGGLIVLASDLIYNTAIDADGSITRPGETIDRMNQGTWRLAPAETLARSPATMLSAGKLAGATMQHIGQIIEADWNERPEYVVNETGEMLASNSQLRLPPKEELAKIHAAKGQTIRPISEQELQKFDYDRFVKRRDTQKLEDDAINNTTAPTEFITMLLTGRNQVEKPIESQAQVGSMVFDPTAIAPAASATARWGVSAFGKKASAKMLGGLEKASGGIVRANDALLDRFAQTVSDQTGVELTRWQKGLQIVKGTAITSGIGAGANALGVDPKVSSTIASSYLLYKGGLGVLRRLETGSRIGKTILRESADATHGLDQAARLAVAANPAVPGIVREALERPTQFIPIESTPARIASNPAFGPTTRAVADRLSNPLAVQAVRNTAALAKGSVKGAITNLPFAYLEANAGNEEGAAGAIGSGLAFGAAGAAFERVGGLRERRAQQAVGDIGRMLVDVELVGGDVGHLVKTRDMQGLADLAALQGYYRNGFDFVPLNDADYNANKRANGQKDMVSPNKAGTAGYFLQVPDGGGKPIIYINLDATNRNPLPHEIGHLITAGGLENPQKTSARAWVEKTYGPEGIKARAEEYARTLIQARANAAARAAKQEPMPVNITPELLSAEMESLGQDGLVRGDLDTMDWARDEIFAETFATNAAAMDWASIRRGNPAGGNFLTFAEGILGAQARGLMAAGVRIDPQTGAPIDTQSSLFKQNPVLAADPEVMKQLDIYSKNFNAYLLNPDQTKPRGARIAPSGRTQDLVNTGLARNHTNDKGGAETLWTVTDPNGVTRPKTQAELNVEQKLRAEQAGNLFQTKKLTSQADPTVAMKKRTDGRREIFGRRLPQNFFFSNSFGRHIRDFARLFEEAMDNGETLNTSYFAVLTKNSDTGAVRDKDLGNAIRIDREIMPFEWVVSKQNNILASVLDITKFRNRVNRAIREGDEPIARLFDNKWENIEPAFKKLLDNHRNNLPGETGLGAEPRDVLNALIGIGTTENKARNPYNGRYGRDSAIERFRLDRINDSVKSGRTSFHFDYGKSAGNALPEIASPLPDLSKDLIDAPGQAMPDRMPEDQRAAETSGRPSPGGSDAEALRKLDSDYLATVERGDMETAQRMVDEAAKKAGYEVEAYHGTRSEMFDKFQPSRGGEFGSGIYFSPRKESAEMFGSYKGGNNPVQVIKSYLRLENPLKTNDRNVPRGMGTKAMVRKGYDGVIGTQLNGDIQYVVFDPSQIKSADPVIRDDAGNVISLSQRFARVSPNSPAPSKGAK